MYCLTQPLFRPGSSVFPGRSLRILCVRMVLLCSEIPDASSQDCQYADDSDQFLPQLFLFIF